MSLTDEWETPDAVYWEICRYWGVYPEYDTFASRANTKCRSFFGLDRDTTNAFDIDWVGTARSQGKDPIFWMNPPYSQPTMTMAIRKALDESDAGGTTVFLLPAFVDQAWYHDLILPFAKHKIHRGRIQFVPPEGVAPSSNRYGSIHGVIRPIW